MRPEFKFPSAPKDEIGLILIVDRTIGDTPKTPSPKRISTLFSLLNLVVNTLEAIIGDRKLSSTLNLVRSSKPLLSVGYLALL